MKHWIAIWATASVLFTADPASAFCLATSDVGDRVLQRRPIPAGVLPVYYHADLDEIAPGMPLDVVVDQLRLAIRLWNEHAPTSARLQLAGSTTADTINGSIIVRREVRRPLSGGGTAGACAATHLACAFPEGPITASEIVMTGATIHIKTGVPWVAQPSGDLTTTRYVLASTLAHELGHALNLGHSDVAPCVRAGRSIMEASAPSNVAPGIHRDDVDGVRHVYPTAGFVLQDMHYSSNGELGTWTRDDPTLEGPALPLTVSNTTPTLATWEDRRVLAFPAIFPAGDLVAIQPGQGDSWGSFRVITTDSVGISHAPVGVAVVDDVIVVAWQHEEKPEVPDPTGVAVGAHGYVSVSTDFGQTFSTPVRLEVLATLPSGNRFVTFATRSTSGYSVEYAESTDSFFVLGTDSWGRLIQWRIPGNTLVPSRTPVLVDLSTTQRPTAVCGRGGRRLDPSPGFPRDIECVIALGGGSALQVLQYWPVGTVGNSLAGPAVFTTNLRLEYSPALLWRTEPTTSPIWLGATYLGHANVVMFNHSLESVGADPWRAASIVPINTTGTSKPLTAVGMGVTNVGNNDVLQFVSGELFP